MYGKQKPLGVTAFAKQAQAKAIAAQAKADALVAKSKSLDLLASAAKEEAQQARARAQEAEKKAVVYKDMAEEARKFADALYGRCSNALDWKYETFHLVGPPLFGGP